MDLLERLHQEEQPGFYLLKSMTGEHWTIKLKKAWFSSQDVCPIYLEDENGVYYPWHGIMIIRWSAD